MGAVSQERPPLTTTTSLWPAAVVVGLGVAVLAIFLLINALATPTVTTTTAPVVVGGLPAAASNAVVTGCQQPGTPPANIAGALVVPAHTAPAGAVVHANGGAGDYDCYRMLATRASAGQILGFYRGRLTAAGWALFSSAQSPTGPEMLFQKAGSDTFYWVVGIAVVGHHGATTTWRFRIYQNSASI